MENKQTTTIQIEPAVMLL